MVYRPSQVIREATRRIPLNAQGLLEGFYRVDLLPMDRIVTGTQDPLKGFGPNASKPSAAGGTSASLTRAPTSATQELSADPILILNEKLLRTAFVSLSYEEGFAVLPEGQPFWAQFEFEPTDAFIAFMSYLEQGKSGSRQLFAVAQDRTVQDAIIGARKLLNTPGHLQGRDNNDGSGLVGAPGHRGVANLVVDNTVVGAPPRSISAGRETIHDDGRIENSVDLRYNNELTKTTKARGGASVADLKEWYHTYYWGGRVAAHDAYFLETIRSKRSMISLAVENRHYSDAARLYGKIMNYITGEGEFALTPDQLDVSQTGSKFWDEVTPKTAVDLLKMITELERISLGIPGKGPAHVQGSRSSNRSPVPTSGRAALGANGQIDPSNPHSGVNGQGAGGSTESLGDEERARRIAAVLNAARARREASS